MDNKIVDVQQLTDFKNEADKVYATKEDITNAVNDAFNRLQGFVTQNELNDVLSGLAVGNGGRIVRINESNA